MDLKADLDVWLFPRGRASGPSRDYAIQTDLTLTNSRIPYSDSSRPYPERLIPPNGSRGSDLTTPFTKTEPASICATSRSALSANMSETVTPRKFSVEGEQGSEADEHGGAGPRGTRDRSNGEGDAAAVHPRLQAEDCPGSRRM